MMEPSPDSSGNGASRHPIRRYAVPLLVVALLFAIWGVVDRVLSRAAIARDTTVAAVPIVQTLKPDRSPAFEELTLPGSVQAFVEAPIYARTNGYLKVWYTDIGARVKKGQILAELDTPEIDQALDQAVADLAVADANALLARTTDERWKGLLKTHSVSQQDADSKAGDASAKLAAANSAKANVARLRDLESFKRVLAPFDGVVTQRNTDIGALINAGQSAGGALFRMADTERLRVYVLVPEPYAAATAVGVGAELRFAEQPGKNFPAKVVRTANALDPGLRTLQVELQVDNSSGALFPGAYAEVHLQLPGSAETLRLPANTLMFRATGLQVATVGSDSRVRLKSIVAGRDFGRTLEILSGITAGDDVIINPTDSITDGALVQIAGPELKPAAATSRSGSKAP